MKAIHFHGELCVREVEAVSGDEVTPQGDFKLADSEVTGNDHMLQVVPGVHIFNGGDPEEYFIKAEVDTTIYCKLKDRHDDLKLPGGTSWKITPAKEWDHINEESRAVAD